MTKLVKHNQLFFNIKPFTFFRLFCDMSVVERLYHSLVRYQIQKMGSYKLHDSSNLQMDEIIACINNNFYCLMQECSSRESATLHGRITQELCSTTEQNK